MLNDKKHNAGDQIDSFRSVELFLKPKVRAKDSKGNKSFHYLTSYH